MKCRFLLISIPLLIGLGGSLTQCTGDFINLSKVPDREEPRIPLSEVQEELRELTQENAQQKAFGEKALGIAFKAEKKK